MAFSDILQEWKERKGWTDQQMADAIGVSRPAVNQWLNKKSSPAIRQLPGIGKVLGRDWMELAAIIIGEEVGTSYELRPLQSSLLAQTNPLSDEEISKIMAMVELLFPRDKPK